MLMLRALRTRGTPQPVRRRETILPSHGTRRRRRVARFRITIQPRSTRRRKALVRRCRSAEGARVGAWAREERSPAAKDRIDRKIHSQRSNSCSPRRTPRWRRANSHELAAPIKVVLGCSLGVRGLAPGAFKMASGFDFRARRSALDAKSSSRISGARDTCLLLGWKQPPEAAHELRSAGMCTARSTLLAGLHLHRSPRQLPPDRRVGEPAVGQAVRMHGGVSGHG